MKELHIKKFDALLSLAAAECVKDEAIAFVSADISGVEDNPQMLRKILGMSNKSKLKALKIIVLVALLCMSIAFTACMLVPEIRNAIWNVFVKEHGDHVEVEFDSGKETEITTDTPISNYPKTIERKMDLSYVPEGCVKGEELEMSAQYQIYFYTVQGEWQFFVSQSVIDKADSFVDDETGQIAYIELNDNKAILIEYYDADSLYSLIWQDNQYRYTIYGTFSSMSEMVQIAKGIN